MSQQYVALVQQGLLLDQHAVAVGEDPRALQDQAQAAADKLNGTIQGEEQGYDAVVVPVQP